MVAILRECLSGSEVVEDGARRLRIEDSLCDAEKYWRGWEGMGGKLGLYR